MKPAPPLEWHPFYQDKPWLMDWLNQGRDTVILPVVPKVRLLSTSEFDGPSPFAQPRGITMTKRKAYAPAPYVGRAFVYMWWVGVDDLGRQIAGESRIVYTEDTPHV